MSQNYPTTIESRIISSEMKNEYKKIHYAILLYFYMINFWKNNLDCEPESIVQEILFKAGISPESNTILFPFFIEIIKKGTINKTDSNGEIKTTIQFYQAQLLICLNNIEWESAAKSPKNFEIWLIGEIKTFTEKHDLKNIESIIWSIDW